MAQWRINTRSKPGAPALLLLRGRLAACTKPYKIQATRTRAKSSHPKGLHNPYSPGPTKTAFRVLSTRLYPDTRPPPHANRHAEQTSRHGGGRGVSYFARFQGPRKSRGVEPLPAAETNSYTKSRKCRRWELTHPRRPRNAGGGSQLIHTEPKNRRLEPAHL